jgi:hypothetical protein
MKNKKSPKVCGAALVLAAYIASVSIESEASYAIYVGKNLTSDGSVLIGGSGDEVSSHWLEIVPATDHAPGTSLQNAPLLDDELLGLRGISAAINKWWIE